MEEFKKEQQIEHYEMLYIIPIKFSDDEAKNIVIEVKKLIADNQGEVTYEEVPEKKRLAYPIKGVHQGHYVLSEFDLPKENLKKVDEKLKLMAEVLRFLILKKKKKTAQEIQKEKERLEKIKTIKEEKEIKAIEQELEKEVKEEKEKKDDKKKKKISLSDLDKKIDEILEDTDKII